MLRILQFIYGIWSFLLFILLEGLAITLLISNNSPQGAAFFNSSNQIVGSLLKKRSDAVYFFSYAEINQKLMQENAALIDQLQSYQSNPNNISIAIDSSFSSPYKFVSARIFSNSLRFSQNHLTLNKGFDDGLKVGMGIFNEDGIIGRIKAVSKNYALGISLLNTGLLISSKIKATENFGSVNWDGNNSRQAKMLYVPRHVKAQAGDTIVTSGYNAVFPEGINIGIIASVSPGADSNYLEIILNLSTDFTNLNFVYVIENTDLVELDSLYKNSEIIHEF